jgi:hypothetical protein
MAAYREYPKMIYHETLGKKVVLNEQELMDSLNKGWSRSPVAISEAKLLRESIAKLEEELRLKKMKLAAIEGINDLPAEEEKPQEKQEEEPQQQVFPPVIRRRHKRG